MQDPALLQLERLTINDIKDFVEYAAQYEELTAKTGRIYLQLEISEKFFRKLPPPFGSKMIELWNQAYPNSWDSTQQKVCIRRTSTALSTK